MTRHALMIYGGWEGHSPRQCVERFVPFLQEQGFAVQLADSLDVLDHPDQLQQQDLIVPCWTMGQLTERQEANVCAAVEAGTGLAGWHGGMGDAFRQNTQWQFMVGGQFVAHPGNVIDYQVDLCGKDDPLVQGLSSFTIRTEQYYLQVDPSNEVLASTTFDGAVYPWIAGTVIPVVWRRTYGAGRVFYSALGHSPEDFDVFECRELMQRGMLWASR